MHAVLYVDDQEEELQALGFQLADRYRVSLCGDARAAASKVARQHPDAVILDLEMPGYDGFRVLSDIRALPDPPPVLMLSAHPEPFFVIRAMQEGAADFLSKPCTGAMLRYRVKDLIDRRRGTTDPSKAADGASDPAKSILGGDSAAMREVRKTIELYAASDAVVLVLGESGTGKDLAARALHRLSKRTGGPFVVRNIASLTESLVESELFGCEDGAYTNARKREGCFEAAHGGTLFLDEIADAGTGVQASLLRVVEDREVLRVGSSRPRKVDCRLVFATNKDLDELAAGGAFRQDLLYRISTLPLRMPPLRSRREDIPELVRRFLAADRRDPEGISAAAMDRLASGDWPGNVRQLKACVERALVLSAGKTIRPEHLGF